MGENEISKKESIEPGPISSYTRANHSWAVRTWHFKKFYGPKYRFNIFNHLVWWYSMVESTV